MVSRFCEGTVLEGRVGVEEKPMWQTEGKSYQGSGRKSDRPDMRLGEEAEFDSGLGNSHADEGETLKYDAQVSG